MNKNNSIVLIFPCAFFILGLFTQAFINIFENLIVISGIMIFALIIYSLLYQWFANEFANEVGQ